MTNTKNRSETSAFDRWAPALAQAAPMCWPVCLQQFVRHQAERARERKARTA